MSPVTWPARYRVVSDNDYAGDPDGLLQLAHHALSPSTELVTVIGSHLRVGDPWNAEGRSAERGAEAARRVLALAGRSEVPVVAGCESALTDRGTPIDSPGARAIVEAALAGDDRPLFVCLGAGLTELASAWLLAPEIAGRLTAVWIGGAEYPGVDAPPGAPASEYNTAIDPVAAQVVLNDSDIPVWQVPRSTYRQALASYAELEQGLVGPLGRHLLQELANVGRLVAGAGRNPGEAYAIGDSPLVLLTALQTAFEPTPASSQYADLPAPVLADDGSYTQEVMPDRLLRVWTRVDTGLMVRDLYAKLAAHAGPREGDR